MFTKARLAMATTLAFAIGLTPSQALNSRAQQQTTYDVVASVFIGDDGLQYSSAPNEEVLVWGPSSLVVDDQGQFWIGTAVTKEVVRVSSEGKVVERIGLGDNTVGLDDFTINSSGIWVLDTASLEQQVRLFDRAGGLAGAQVLPPELTRSAGVTGMEKDPADESIYLTGGTNVSALIADKLGTLESPSKLSGRTFGGFPYLVSTDVPAAGEIFANSAKVTTPYGSVRIRVKNSLAGISILSASPEFGLYVLVTEMDPLSPVIKVDEVVQHFDMSTGLLIGLARVPLQERYTFVEHGTAVGPDGSVFSLITRANSIDIVRLGFASRIEPIIVSAPGGLTRSAIGIAGYGTMACSIARTTIINTANSFASNSVSLNSTNTDGGCPGRGKPRYIGGAGTYSSVPYDWDGFDTPSGYNAFMGQNYQAGDINTAGAEGCSKGVDCSGLVSRAWGLTSKYGTYTLETVSSVISRSALQQGDILNLAGTHTVIFRWNGSYNQVNVIESTTTNNLDRVYAGSWDWSRFNGYTSRKYNNVCP